MKDAVLNALLGRRHAQASELVALRDISLQLMAGDRLGVLGLNGAGKTTLLKTIARVYRPSAGRVHISGRLVPLIELGAGFNLEFSGRENIHLNAAVYGHRRDEIRAHEREILAFAELEAFADQPLKYYSSGMMARLSFSIATAFASPDILLSDEVFAAGDARFVDRALTRMHTLFDDAGVVVFVSHSIEQVKQLCNRAIVLHKGHMMGMGSPSDMADLYAHICACPAEYSRET